MTTYQYNGFTTNFPLIWGYEEEILPPKGFWEKIMKNIETFYVTSDYVPVWHMDNIYGVDKLPVEKLSEDAIIPTRGSENSAGLDLYANESVTIGAGFRALISTGIAMAIPTGMVGLIWPRSGLSVKSGIDVLAGVVDSDYRGDIGVCLLNTNSDKRNGSVYIKKGDRIAQLIIQQYQSLNICEVESLNETGRGSGGFGSTGK